MPLEGGVTAIVGPNGSGKSNITDAVLFALGEQSPGVLRAGAMSELIFSGSETLPAASAAEVTLVLDNEEGRISLPYREVSISRRISRSAASWRRSSKGSCAGSKERLPQPGNTGRSNPATGSSRWHTSTGSQRGNWTVSGGNWARQGCK